MVRYKMLTESNKVRAVNLQLKPRKRKWESAEKEIHSNKQQQPWSEAEPGILGQRLQPDIEIHES